MRPWAIAVFCAMLVAGMCIVVWHFGFRMCKVRLVPRSGESTDWVYFPVAARRGRLSLPTSYMKQVDFPAYNVEMITPLDPVALNRTWCFRRRLGADRIGFVFRLWPVKGEIDNSDVRVFWVDQAQIEKAVNEGELRIPPIRALPQFPKKDLDLLTKVARNLPEP